MDIMWIEVDRGGCTGFNSLVIMLILCSDAVAQYRVPMNTKMTVRGVMLDLSL